MNVDYYETLGVERDSSAQDIKQAYREKSKTTHPDKGGSDEEFARVNEAYKVLSNDEARKIYDATGKSIYNPIEIEEESKILLVSIFEEILDIKTDQFSQFEYGIIGCLSEMVEQRLQARGKDVKIITKRIEKLIDSLGVITRKDDEPNIFDDLINDKIKIKEQDLALAELDVKIIQHAIKILDDYDCKVKSGGIDMLFESFRLRCSSTDKPKGDLKLPSNDSFGCLDVPAITDGDQNDDSRKE